MQDAASRPSKYRTIRVAGGGYLLALIRGMLSTNAPPIIRVLGKVNRNLEISSL